MPSQLRRNLRYCTFDGIAAMPAVFLLTPGNFAIAALLTSLYHLPTHVYGVIVSLPFWCNFIQIGLTPLLASALRAKAVAVWSAAVQFTLLAGLAIGLHWLPQDQPEKTGPWFIALFTLLGVTSAFAAVGWTSWVQEWVPGQIHGRYFGIRNQVLQVATLIFLVTVFLLLQRYHESVLAFQLMILCAVVLRIGSTIFQQKTLTAPHAAHLENKRPWREQMEELRGHSSFLWFVGFGAAWGFAANCIGPFYTVFMYQQVGLSVGTVTLLTTLVCVGGILSYPAWGLLAQRFGSKPVIFFCMISWQVQNYLWCFITRENAWLLYCMWIFGGVMSAGVLLGMFNILLKLIPPSAKTAAISLNIAVSSLVTALAPIIGGWLLEILKNLQLDAMTIYHRLFLLQPTVAILACIVLLRRVHEPRASGLTTVFGAMRNVRTLGSIFGLTYLVNFVFVKNQKR